MKKPPFEWDDDKAAENLKKHGVAFEEAATIFLDQHAFTFYDRNHSQEEDRWITHGVSNKKRPLTVWTTERGEVIRIIGARKATKNERKKYESKIQGHSRR